MLIKEGGASTGKACLYRQMVYPFYFYLRTCKIIGGSFGMYFIIASLHFKVSREGGHKQQVARHALRNKD